MTTNTTTDPTAPTSRVTLAIVSQKGGVGKTTLAVNLAYALARDGHRVLLVDTDTQNGIAHALARRCEQENGLAGFLFQNAPLPDVLISTRLPGLSILPAGNIAIEDTALYESSVQSGAPFRQLIDAAGDFDLVLFDTPAGFGGATMGVLRATRHIVTPLQAEPMAVRSLQLLLEAITAVAAADNPGLQLTAIILNMLQLRNDTSLSAAESIWEELPRDLVLNTVIPRDEALLKASEFGVPAGLLTGKPAPVAQVFSQIASELAPRLDLTGSTSTYGHESLFA